VAYPLNNLEQSRKQDVAHYDWQYYRYQNDLHIVAKISLPPTVPRMIEKVRLHTRAAPTMARKDAPLEAVDISSNS
jgi:hypothetical protein